MSEERKLFLLILTLILAVLILIVSVIHQAVGVSKLKHALNLKPLPSSVGVRKWGGESWTDYLYVAVITIDEEDYEELLKGRKFRRQHWHEEVMEPSYISGFSPMRVDEQFSWSPRKSRASCTVTFFEGYTQAYVEYMAD